MDALDGALAVITLSRDLTNIGLGSWVPSGAASRGCLRPVSGQNGTDRFFGANSTPEECKFWIPSEDSLSGRSREILISRWGRYIPELGRLARERREELDGHNLCGFRSKPRCGSAQMRRLGDNNDLLADYNAS
jgi:hypothetical protein